MKIQKYLFSILVLCCLQHTLPAQERQPRIFINELMASNTSKVTSPDYKEYADWIELYNPFDSSVALTGFTLTDDLDELDKWMFPAGTQVPPRGYLVMWADDHNTGLHTNFKLAADGEAIALADPSGAIVDSLSYPQQLSDYSYGRSPDGAAAWLFFASVTPGASNQGSGYLGLAEEPNYSLPGGFYHGRQQVILSAGRSVDHIYFTRDGSVPTEESELYTGYLVIDTTTVIRARTLRPGYLPSKAATHTFFIDESVTLPVVSVATDPANLWDDRIGIYVIGTNGVIGYCSTAPRNWNQPWEKPVSVEMWETGGAPGFAIDMGMQIGGGCTRLYAEKPLAFFTRGQYGYTELEYKLFSDRPMTRYNNFLLRNSGQDWWRAMFRDGLMHTLVKKRMDIDWLAYRPTILFLNGAYWGIHDLREKHNEHYIAGNYGIDPDQIDILANNAEVEQGSAALYQAMIQFITTHDLAVPGNYAWVTAQMDIHEYLDYQIAEIYFANIDWPGGNIEYWRQQGDGHKWRWIMFDTDLGFGAHQQGQYNSNTLENVTSPTSTYYANPSWSTFLLRSLLKNAAFRNEFIQRFAAHLNTTFAPERVTVIIDSLKKQIEPEIPRHIKKWPQSTSYNGGWSYHLDVINEFAVKRPDQVRQHLTGKFSLSGMAQLTLSCDPVDCGQIILAGLEVPPDYSGSQFKGIPLTVQAVPKRGYRFTGWQGITTSTEDSVSVTLNADASLTARFIADATVEYPGLKINEVMALNSSTRADEYGEFDDWIELYNGTAAAVDIGGMYISDNLSKPQKFQIPATQPQITTIAAGGYLLLWADGTPAQGVLHLSIKLSGDGEEIGLWRQTASGLVTVDSVIFGAQSSNVSWGRSPDGSNNLKILGKPTPGQPNSTTGVLPDPDLTPGLFRLQQNFPNPFNARTAISYELDRDGPVRIGIYDVAGREIRILVDEKQTRGSHQVVFDAGDLPSGVYLCRLSLAAAEQSIKMLLVR